MDVAQEKLQDDMAQAPAVELASSDSIANATGNGTTRLPNQEQIDIENLLDDWRHLRNLPSVKSVFLFMSSFVYGAINLFLGYFLWEVVDILAIVEAPQVVVPARAPWSAEKADADEVPQVEVKQERAVTSSLRTTTRHLYRVGGATAFLRGLACSLCIMAGVGVFVALCVATGAVVENPRSQWDETISSRLLPDMRSAVFETLAFLLFSPWVTAWVHIIITQPTLRIWYRRLPPFLPTVRATWRPILLDRLADFVIWKVVPRLLRWTAGFYMPDYKQAEGFITSDNILRSLFWAIAYAGYLSAYLPIYMATIRVQASLLPEDEETIIPVDRTFGSNGPNGLRPGLLAESRGALSLTEAWRSVTWDELRRVIVIRAKFLAVNLVVSAIFWIAIGSEAIPNEYIPWKYNW